MDQDTIIKVDHVSMKFNLSSEKVDNFKEYLIEYKLTIAKKLLEEGINVTKVAEKVGYQDVRQFTRIFKKYMGVTPNVYQTSHKT